MFGIVEIMGHRTRAGRLSDVTIGGATMLRIEHPSRAATFDNNEPETELYAPAAIFAIRLCTEDEARAAAEYSWPPRRSVNQAALASPFDELVEDDDFDDDMDLYERTER